MAVADDAGDSLFTGDPQFGYPPSSGVLYGHYQEADPFPNTRRRMLGRSNVRRCPCDIDMRGRYSGSPSTGTATAEGDSVERDTFQKLQYLTLRKEIETSLERAFKIMVGGAAFVPLLVGVIAYYKATPILLTLPMVVVVSALLYLNQWNSIMRCGRYIRTKIEPELVGNDGWEGWLESSPDSQAGAVHNRLADIYVTCAFYLLSGAYYFGTSYTAMTYAALSYGTAAKWTAFGVYVFVALAMGVIILRRVPTHTTTRKERENEKDQNGVSKLAVETPNEYDESDDGILTSDDISA